MIAAAEDDMHEHVPPSVLSGIKEKLAVTDFINQLDIADGLKELLLSRGFTLESLLNARISRNNPLSSSLRIPCISLSSSLSI
jgi:hypothetical protein